MLIASLSLAVEEYLLEKTEPLAPAPPAAQPQFRLPYKTNSYCLAVTAYTTNLESNFSNPVIWNNWQGGTNRFADGLIVAWNAVSYPGVIGYRVWWGPAPASFTNAVDVGNVTECSIVMISPPPPRQLVMTILSSGKTMEVTSNLLPPVVWLPVSTNVVKLTNPLGNWFYRGSNVIITATNL